MADIKADPKEGGNGFFRKVVRFVANPATNWADLDSVPAPPTEDDDARAELRAMIERKRRNDFVRKREFDTLRKIRREGLQGAGAASLSSGEDSDNSDLPRNVERPEDAAVKAKIDQIEQQMEGESDRHWDTSLPHPPSFYSATTIQSDFPSAAATTPDPAEPALQAVPAPVPTQAGAASLSTQQADTGPAPEHPGLEWRPLPAAAAVTPLGALASPSNPFVVEIHEIDHDPVLDEAVISFANAEFEHCEQTISALIAPEGPRARHAETWLALFDLYRATGQQQPFESLALEYLQQFGWSPPQWFSIPQLIANESSLKAVTLSPSARPAPGTGVGWVAPDRLQMEGVMELRARTLQMPMPWLLDWTSLQAIEPEACNELTQILRHWSRQSINMRWIGFDHLLSVLGDTAPPGVRDADPVYWLLKLEVLRLADRPDRFDEVAIDYCVTYEVSPPSWERAVCLVKMVDSSGLTMASRMSVTDVPTGFVDSRIIDEADGERTAAVELSGQLVGDIDRVLEPLAAKLGNAGVVNINCARLIRMDFVAAGGLLNWVLQRRTENRLVHFEDAHRLIGLFFNAMGINEHARVKVRNH